MLTNTEKALVQILLKMGLDQNEMVWTMLKLKEKEKQQLALIEFLKDTKSKLTSKEIIDKAEGLAKED